MSESEDTVKLVQEDRIGRNVKIVAPSKNPMHTMQTIGHLSDDPLGVVVRDKINGDTRWFKHGSDGLWLEFFETVGRFDAHEPEYLSDLFDVLGGQQAVVPAAAMPYFGDDSINLDQIFD